MNYEFIMYTTAVPYCTYIPTKHELLCSKISTLFFNVTYTAAWARGICHKQWV